jgi:DNA-binding IclR family transcriptional regulator
VIPRIQSIDRALTILEIVSRSSAPLHPREIAEQIQLPLATAHNIIRSLFHRGYLVQDKTRKYLLGHKCLELQVPAVEHFAHLRRVSQKHLDALAAETGDTTAIGCEYNMGLYYVAHSLGAGEIIVQPTKDTDYGYSMNVAAIGKVIIANKGISFFQELLKMNRIRRYNDATIVDTDRMQEQIAFFHEKGFALCNRERSTEVAAIAVPIFDRDNTFVGGIGQNFPATYLDFKIVIPAERAELLTKYADKIRDEL